MIRESSLPCTVKMFQNLLTLAQVGIDEKVLGVADFCANAWLSAVLCYHRFFIYTSWIPRERIGRTVFHASLASRFFQGTKAEKGLYPSGSARGTSDMGIRYPYVKGSAVLLSTIWVDRGLHCASIFLKPRRRNWAFLRHRVLQRLEEHRNPRR